MFHIKCIVQWMKCETSQKEKAFQEHSVSKRSGVKCRDTQF